MSRQEYWSRLPFPPSGDLPNPGTQPTSPTLAGGFFNTEQPRKPNNRILLSHKNEIMPFAATWMQPEVIIPSERSQKEKDKYYMILLIYGI